MVPFLGALFVSGLEEPTRTHEKQLHVHWTSLHEVLMTANIVGFLSPLPSIQVQDKGAIRSNCVSCFLSSSSTRYSTAQGLGWPCIVFFQLQDIPSGETLLPKAIGTALNEQIPNSDGTF
jgi:hypothetical protein